MKSSGNKKKKPVNSKRLPKPLPEKKTNDRPPIEPQVLRFGWRVGLNDDQC